MEGIPTIKNTPPPEEKVKPITQEKITEWVKLENHVFDENNFFRIVSEKGYEDFLTTGVIRSSPTGTESDMHGKFDLGHRPTSFPSFSKGKPALEYLKRDADNFIFETETPLYSRGDNNPITGNPIRGRHWAYRHINKETGETTNEITQEMIKNIYKISKNGEIYLKK